MTIDQWYLKKGKYSFIITNTDSFEKGGMHWWSILDIEPQTDWFFSYLFSVDGLKSFIIQDDKKVIENIPFGTKKLARAVNKRTLVNAKIFLNACKNLTKKIW